MENANEVTPIKGTSYGWKFVCNKFQLYIEVTYNREVSQLTGKYFGWRSVPRRRYKTLTALRIHVEGRKND